MQRAIIAGIAVAIICSVIGLFLVLKKHSLFGDAMSHVAFGGLSLGLFLNLYPMWTAFIFTVLAGLGITKLRDSITIPHDYISSLTYEEVDRGVITRATIIVRPSSQCVIAGFALSMIAGTAAPFAVEGIKRLFKRVKRWFKRRAAEEREG